MKKFILLTSVCAGLLFAGNSLVSALKIEVEDTICSRTRTGSVIFEDTTDFERLKYDLAQLLKLNASTERIILLASDGDEINDDAGLEGLGNNANINVRIMPVSQAPVVPVSEQPVPSVGESIPKPKLPKQLITYGMYDPQLKSHVDPKLRLAISVFHIYVCLHPDGTTFAELLELVRRKGEYPPNVPLQLSYLNENGDDDGVDLIVDSNHHSDLLSSVAPARYFTVTQVADEMPGIKYGLLFEFIVLVDFDDHKFGTQNIEQVVILPKTATGLELIKHLVQTEEGMRIDLNKSSKNMLPWRMKQLEQEKFVIQLAKLEIEDTGAGVKRKLYTTEPIPYDMNLFELNIGFEPGTIVNRANSFCTNDHVPWRVRVSTIPK